MKRSDFSDVHAETNVLAGILRYGRDAFIDVDDIVQPGMFGVDLNQILYKIVREHHQDGTAGPIDFATLMVHARRLGADGRFDADDAKEHVRKLLRFKVSLDTVRSEAAKIRKLRVAQGYDELLAEGRRNLNRITGDESLSSILAMVENPLAEYASSLDDGQTEGPAKMSEGGEEWLENVIANPVENIGIPSPFPTWNRQTDGIHMEGVTLFGARMKVGKTHLADNLCLHVAGKLGIPVLNVDREMTRKQHLARVLANITGIDSRKISKGDVTPEEADELRKAVRWLDSIPYYYESVIDKSFEQQIAGMRRWCIKHVPVGEDGVRSRSMILYDYLKVCDEGDLSNNVNESQRLGYMMMSLVRLAAKMPTSVVSMIQLNRDGDDKESSTVIFGSDRPAQSCVSFTILKKKTEAELEDDGRENGTHKLVNVMTRFGEGGEGDYISLHFDGSTSRITEGKTNFQLRRERGARKSTEETFNPPKRSRKPKEAKNVESDPAPHLF